MWIYSGVQVCIKLLLWLPEFKFVVAMAARDSNFCSNLNIYSTQFTMVLYIIFWLTMVQKQYAFNGNCTLNFQFWYFPGLVMSGMYNSLWWCWAAAVSPSSHSTMWSQGQTTSTLQCTVLPAFLQYYVLCFHIWSCLQMPICVSRFWWEKKRKAITFEMKLKIFAQHEGIKT